MDWISKISCFYVNYFMCWFQINLNGLSCFAWLQKGLSVICYQIYLMLKKNYVVSGSLFFTELFLWFPVFGILYQHVKFTPVHVDCLREKNQPKAFLKSHVDWQRHDIHISYSLLSDLVLAPCQQWNCQTVQGSSAMGVIMFPVFHTTS